jgi:hypothetical protein
MPGGAAVADPFVTGQDSLGTIATTEIVAVEVVRALCGSVGLIAAVPLTTVLAALVTTEAPPEVQARPTGDGGRPPKATTGLHAGPMVTGPEGRSGSALARRLGQAGLVLDCVLAVHGPHLSQAMVDLDSGGWLATEEFPAAARRAAVPGWPGYPVTTAFGHPVRARPARRRTD